MKTRARQPQDTPGSPENRESCEDASTSTSLSPTMGIFSRHPKDEALAAASANALKAVAAAPPAALGVFAAARARALPASRAMEAFLVEVEQRIRDLYAQANFSPLTTLGQITSLGIQYEQVPLAWEGSPFVEPIPLSTMRAWVGEVLSWEVNSRGSTRWNKNEHACFRNAEQKCEDITSYAVRTHKGDKITSILTRARYSTRVGRPSMSGRGKMWYGVRRVFQYNNPECPHVSAVLAEDIDLPGILTMFELFVMENLTRMRLDDGVLGKATFIPVTLISFGDCRGRLVHGYFDPKSKRIHLWASKPINFDYIDCYMTEGWLRLLCWLLAKPISDGRHLQ